MSVFVVLPQVRSGYAFEVDTKTIARHIHDQVMLVRRKRELLGSEAATLDTSTSTQAPAGQDPSYPVAPSSALPAVAMTTEANMTAVGALPTVADASSQLPPADATAAVGIGLSQQVSAVMAPSVAAVVLESTEARSNASK